ncbi:protein phosphatase 1B [Drosophila miranda]|uniref:protein phosphatase 1B n=1 Tax=Drosophila miranda TaxID=7229 RepID=UPI0007E7135D|nr:protein phosphatase 1B [Drosophila miranda]
MGGLLEKPSTDKEIEMGSGNGLQYCVSAMQGWRMEMEDAHTAVCRLSKPFDLWSFFAIFDGHGGGRISAYCSEHLLSTIISNEQFARGQYVAGIHDAFLYIDDEMRRLCPDKSGGSTATCAFVSPDKIYLANCGDSRVVLSQNGQTEFSSWDHKPNLPLERARIVRAGGSVIIQRVNGTLAVSRALGDFDFKSDSTRSSCDQLVSPEPDLTVLDRTPTDEFLVIACDGIWDVMSSEGVCAFIRSRLCVTANINSIVNSVLDICLHKGSRDNMSLLLVLLPGAPSVNVDAVAADQRLDHTIEQLTREAIQKNELLDFEELLSLMHGMAFNITDLPPGAGIYAKYHIIERVFHDANPDKPPEFFEYKY